MEPEVKQDTNSPEFVTEKITVNIEKEDSGSLAPLSSFTSSDQWKQVGKKASEVLADLPDYVTDFFGEYRRPLVTVGLIFGAIIASKLTLAILSAINDLPLLASLFELIGLGYSGWFIYRYLLKASNREELGQDFTALREQILGKINKEL